MKEHHITAITELDSANYVTKVYAGGHFIFADEPEEVGGTNKGMTPAALLLASLGSCTAITIRMYADRKQIPLEAIRIHLEICQEEDISTSTRINRTIALSGNLTTEQRNRIFEIADRCPIHRMLTNPIEVRTMWG